MELLIAIILISAAAAYLTSIPCRLLYRLRRRASWFLGFVGAAVVGILTVLLLYQGDVIHPDRWDRGKVELELMMLMVFGFSSAVALIPALIVVGHYRRKLKGETPVV
jgi:hypothetical protein